MKKNTILFIALILLSNISILYSQGTYSKINFYFLQGKANNENAIMHLYIEGTNLSGTYYDSENYELELKGYIQGSKISMSDDKKKYIISGELDNNINIIGKLNSKSINLSLINSLEILDYSYDNEDIEGLWLFYNIREILFNENIYNIIRSYNDMANSMIELYYDGYLEYGYGESRHQNIEYIDNKIIIVESSSYLQTGVSSGGSSFSVYSAETLKPIEIEIKDLISERNFYNLISKKTDDISYWKDRHAWEYGYFNIKYNGSIIFYRGSAGSNYGIFEENDLAEFTFEEIKPFIKKGSPLEYLFN